MALALCFVGPNPRSYTVAAAAAEAAQAAGFDYRLVNHDHAVIGAAMCFGYGYQEMRAPIERCTAVGIPFVFFDLGYRGRCKDHPNPAGHYRIALNSHQPSDRLLAIAAAQPARRGSPVAQIGRGAPVRKPRVLVLGMSVRAAWSFGLDPLAWERWAIDEILAAGGTAFFRPKPTCAGSPKTLPGAGSLPAELPLRRLLSMIDGVVAYHSSGLLEATERGLSIYGEVGPAKIASHQHVKHATVLPALPAHIRQRALDASQWLNWSLADIQAGVMLHELQRTGLLPVAR